MPFFSRVRPVTSDQLSFASCCLLNHWNVLEKLFVFYVYSLQVNYAATKSMGKTTGSLLWEELKNRKANRDTIVVEAVDVTQMFFATECAQLVVDVVA